MRVLALELRRTPVRFVFPALLVLDLLAVFRDTGFWGGNWQATSLYVEFAAVLVAPLMAAAGAWTAQRRRRTGHAAIAATMPRPPLASIAAQWAAGTAWGVLAYAIGFVAAAAKTAPDAVSGGPWWSFVALGAVAIAAYSAVGYAAGALVAWRGVAPVVGIAVFAWSALLSQTDWSARLGLLYGHPLLEPSRALSARAVLIALAWGTALLVLAAGLASAAQGAPRARLVAAAVPAVAILVLALAAGPRELRQRTPAADVVCAGAAPRVCVWPEHAKYARPAAQVAQRLSVALRGIARYPATIYEPGLGPSRPANAPAVSIASLPVTRASLVAGLSRDVLPATPPSCSDMAPRLRRFVLLKAWMEMRGADALAGDVSTDGTALQQLLDRSDAGQRRWVRLNLPAAVGCSAPLPTSPGSSIS